MLDNGSGEEYIQSHDEVVKELQEETAEVTRQIEEETEKFDKASGKLKSLIFLVVIALGIFICISVALFIANKDKIAPYISGKLEGPHIFKAV